MSEFKQDIDHMEGASSAEVSRLRDENVRLHSEVEYLTAWKRDAEQLRRDLDVAVCENIRLRADLVDAGALRLADEQSVRNAERHIENLKDENKCLHSALAATRAELFRHGDDRDELLSAMPDIALFVDHLENDMLICCVPMDRLRGLVKRWRESIEKNEPIKREYADLERLRREHDAATAECRRLKAELEASESISEARRSIGEAALKRLGVLDAEGAVTPAWTKNHAAVGSSCAALAKAEKE